MNNALFEINPATGLATFPNLCQKYSVKNYVTYINQIWGNMNPYLTDDEDEKTAIDQKDRQLADSLNTKTVALASTPLAGSLIHYDQIMHNSLNEGTEPAEDGYKFILLPVNGVILEQPQVGVVFAPRDCPILAFVHPEWKGVGLLHLGAPQAMQGLHHKFLSYLQSIRKLNAADFEVFVTPYICPEHYYIRREKYENYTKSYPQIESYARTKRAPDQEVSHFVNFMQLIKDELNQTWGIHKFYETGVCNYEEAPRGNLFSYKLTKEQPDQYPAGCYNVAFMLSE